MAIAVYLKSLPPTASDNPPTPDAQAMRAGEAVFVASCSVCHSEPGAGEPRDYPDLAGDTLIMGRDPATVIRIVLQGAESASTPNAPTRFSMPAFATLSDQEIANVTTYVRNAWHNRASPVSPENVKTLRETLMPKSG